MKKMNEMNNYEVLRDTLKGFFESRNIVFDIETNLHEASRNDQKQDRYVYNGTPNLTVVSMDKVAQIGYKAVKEAPDDMKRTVNTVDAFLIGAGNEWFFIEFKDCKLSSKKDNIEKKGMANWMMLQDIFYIIGADACRGLIDLSNPCKFARDHIVYIVVCNSSEDPYTYEQVRNCDLKGEKYTPPCLYKFKDYFFKDAYAYTESFFEKRFVKRFVYD